MSPAVTHRRLRRGPLATLVVAGLLGAVGVVGLWSTPAGAAVSATPAAAGPIVPVASVDIARYLGTWKQIADIPQAYEVFCVGDVTANYSLNADGTVRVANTCAGPFGLTIPTTGAARVLNPGANSQLQVSFLNLFGRQIFNGSTPNYVIIGLAADYSWAVVGDPGRASGYVLSRTPTLSSAATTAARAALVRSGYDPCALTLTKQTGGQQTTGKFC